MKKLSEFRAAFVRRTKIFLSFLLLKKLHCTFSVFRRFEILLSSHSIITPERFYFQIHIFLVYFLAASISLFRIFNTM